MGYKPACMAFIWAKLVFRLSLPVASIWAKRQELRIMKTGIPLHASLLEDARTIGIRFPERVRLQVVDEVPAIHPVLRFLGRQLGLCSPLTRGMSLRYGIFIHSSWRGERGLIVHELAHTWQYE